MGLGWDEMLGSFVRIRFGIKCIWDGQLNEFVWEITFGTGYIFNRFTCIFGDLMGIS